MREHIAELRTRVTNSLVVLAAVFIICYYFSNTLYSLVAKPFLNKLPAGTSLIATQVTATFMVPMQLSFLCALLISAPFLLYQAWQFISPGLYKPYRSNHNS